MNLFFFQTSNYLLEKMRPCELQTKQWAEGHYKALYSKLELHHQSAATFTFSVIMLKISITAGLTHLYPPD